MFVCVCHVLLVTLWFCVFAGKQFAGRSTSLRPAVCNVPTLRTAKFSLRMSDDAAAVPEVAAAAEVLTSFLARAVKRVIESVFIAMGYLLDFKA